MQRTKDVLAALKFLERHDMMQANIHSVAIAKLATMVAHSLGGKKVSVSAEDFLPFDMRKFRQENGMSEASGFVLKSLLKTRKLDPRLLAVLSDEIKTMSMREEE